MELLQALQYDQERLSNQDGNTIKKLKRMELQMYQDYNALIKIEHAQPQTSRDSYSTFDNQSRRQSLHQNYFTERSSSIEGGSRGASQKRYGSEEVRQESKHLFPLSKINEIERKIEFYLEQQPYKESLFRDLLHQFKEESKEFIRQIKDERIKISEISEMMQKIREKVKKNKDNIGRIKASSGDLLQKINKSKPSTHILKFLIEKGEFQDKIVHLNTQAEQFQGCIDNLRAGITLLESQQKVISSKMHFIQNILIRFYKSVLVNNDQPVLTSLKSKRSSVQKEINEQIVQQDSKMRNLLREKDFDGLQKATIQANMMIVVPKKTRRIIFNNNINQDKIQMFKTLISSKNHTLKLLKTRNELLKSPKAATITEKVEDLISIEQRNSFRLLKNSSDKREGHDKQTTKKQQINFFSPMKLMTPR